MTKWFNHYLKGEDNGVEKDATVRYYVMGATGEAGAPGNIWREAKDFPPASTAAMRAATTPYSTTGAEASSRRTLASNLDILFSRVTGGRESPRPG